VAATRRRKVGRPAEARGTAEQPATRALDAKAVERIARALSDRSRFLILREIAREPEISCGAIAERFPIRQPTVSHHLRVLTEAGLLDSRKAGQHHHFRVRREVLHAYLRAVRDELLGSPDGDGHCSWGIGAPGPP
jgi:DNA-binding transcriptional ArsR family regulator